MLVEFWLAAWFGRVWLRVHRSLRPALAGLPSECALAARGEKMAAERLWQVQDFAVRVWARFAIAMALLLFPVGFALGVSTAMRLATAKTALTWMLYTIGCTIMVAIAQFGVIRYRSSRNRLRWALGLSSKEDPLPDGSDGLPRRSDFWLATLVTVTTFLILLYAGTRSAHS